MTPPPRSSDDRDTVETVRTAGQRALAAERAIVRSANTLTASTPEVTE